MRLKMRLEAELLDERQLDRILQHALAIWKDVPFRVQGTEEFCSYLSDYGCEIDGELVRFPQPVIDKVLDRVRSERGSWEEAHGADPPPWPGNEYHMFTHGQGLHICDPESNELRPCLTADLERWCRMVDGLAEGIGRQHPTFIPQDAPRGAQDFHAYATIILNSKRSHRVSVYSTKMLPFFIEASRIAEGSLEAVRANPIFAAKCWVTSPFMLTRENIEIAMDARRLLDQPITFGMMPVAGASTPISVAGALAQNTAESLAVCAMRLAIDDLTQGLTSTSSIMDMRDANQRQSGPDLALHVIAGAQMQAHVFGGRPSFTSGYNGVGAKVVSPQSVYEKASATALSFAAGARSLGIGCLAYSDVGSPVQLVLDYEMGLYYRELLREVNLDDEHVGVEAILDTAPTGAYFLNAEHTARHFREECWFPAFLDHRPPLAWAQDPRDMIDAACRRARDLASTAENQCPLSDSERQTIRQLMTEAATSMS